MVHTGMLTLPPKPHNLLLKPVYINSSLIPENGISVITLPLPSLTLC